MFRRAKLRLDRVDPEVIAAAQRPGAVLVGRLGLTDANGGPVCASVPADAIAWAAEPG